MCADVLTLARQFNGTDFDGDNVTDWSMCHSLSLWCQAPHILLDIATNVLQYQGPKQGALFGGWQWLCGADCERTWGASERHADADAYACTCPLCADAETMEPLYDTGIWDPVGCSRSPLHPPPS
jgi:hypothetical protein